MKFKRRHGQFEQGCVLSESYAATDALPLILPVVFSVLYFCVVCCSVFIVFVIVLVTVHCSCYFVQCSCCCSLF
jgi:hypothetical protein